LFYPLLPWPWEGGGIGLIAADRQANEQAAGSSQKPARQNSPAASGREARREGTAKGGSMSFRVELAVGRRRRPRRSATRSSSVVCVEGAVKGGRSPAKRTLEGVRNANTLKGLGLVAAFRGQRPSPSGGKDFTALGGGARAGAPAGLGRGLRLTGVGSTRNDLNPLCQSTCRLDRI